MYPNTFTQMSHAYHAQHNDHSTIIQFEISFQTHVRDKLTFTKNDIQTCKATKLKKPPITDFM